MANIQWNRVTWYSKTLALLIFIIFPFVGFYLGIQYGQAIQQAYQSTSSNWTQTQTQTSTGTTGGTSFDYYSNPKEWQSYRSDDGAFTIAYPIDFSVTTDHPNAQQPDWRVNSASQVGTKFFTLTIPKAFEPQTNFVDAKLTVGSSRSPVAVSQCLLPDPTAMPAIATTTAIINGITFTIFPSSDAGAGNFYQTESYRTLHGGQCYAFEYTTHSTQIANYPAEYNLKQFDQGKVDSLMQGIIETAKFL